MGNGKFCPSCGASSSAASSPPAFEPAQPEQPPAWNNDPRNVNVNQQPAFDQPQPAWQAQQPMQQQPAWQPVPVPKRRPFYARWWFWVLVVIGVLFVIGVVVGGGEGLSEQELVGRWGWDENTSWTYQFDADGTGSRTHNAGRERFYWSVSGRTLRIESQTNRNLQFNRRIERWTMRYNNGELSLSLEGTTYRYIRMGGGGANVIDAEPTVPAETTPAPATVTAAQVVGTWNWDEHPTWQYFFAPNGEGTRGGGGASVEEFAWEVENGVLFINSIDGRALQFGVANEEWSVRIADGAMTLRSRQAQNMEYTYLRAE